MRFFPTPSLAFVLSLLPVGMASAQSDDGVTTLDPYLVRAVNVANETPLPTYANPVSLLNFAARVDVQSRNFAEAQGDVSIRGGTFENTGFTVGNLAIFDPQTGHYLTEQPIDPMMLGQPEVLTGYANFQHGFNATSGTIRFRWRPLSAPVRQLILSFGENRLNTQSLYIAEPLRSGSTQITWDAGIARSESDGSIRAGDHSFERYAARLQIRTPRSQLHLFAGYQDKFFGWPNLYTPFNVDETESIQTLLLLTDFQLQLDADSTLSLAGYYRKNQDDYEFDRSRPGLYNPYEHTTEVAGFRGGWTGSPHSDIQWSVSADVFADGIDSTSLTHSFQSRTYRQLKAHATAPTWWRSLSTSASLSWFDTNRNRSALDSALQFSWDLSSTGSAQSRHLTLEYSSSSQVSGYTAIGSAPSGLFAGNASLDTERSHNLELAYSWSSAQTTLQFAGFLRQDRDLTDWTFSFSQPNARRANEVDIDTIGFEFLMRHQWKQSDLTLAYTHLHKRESYGSAQVDASFYAMNFPRHRVTVSLVHPLHRKLELRLDGEYRNQEPNPLRRSTSEAWLAYLSLRWKPLEQLDWDLRLSVDNLFDSDYEEIPAVPAGKRQIAIQSSLRW